MPYTKSILFATKNPGKLKEFRDAFDKIRSGYDVLSLEDLGYEINDCEETGETFLDNAIIKARNAQSQLKPIHKDLIIVADDSGMAIDALNGAPGVHTRRWNGTVMTDEEIIEYCMEKMRGIKNRNASYITNFVMLFPNGEFKSIVGENKGIILDEPNKSSILNGMPFRALFYVPSLKMMFHEVRELTLSDRKSYILGHEDAVGQIAQILNSK